MKIALAQINTTIGDFQGNGELIIRNIKEARKRQAQLVVFPELAICGYPPQDLVEYRSFLDKNLEILAKVMEATSGIGCIVGYVDRNPDESGRNYRNVLAFIQDKKKLGTYAKRLLPDYDVFDEYRYFQPGRELGVFPFQGATIGVSICEDIWNDKEYWGKKRYEHDPIEEQVSHGADLLINISASPFSLSKRKVRRKILKSLTLKHRRPICYVNLVGGNDELIFDGRSFVVNSQGEIVYEAKAFQEELAIIDTDRLESKEFPEPEVREEIIQALVLGVRDYFRKCGFTKAILGLSGGVDSALTAVLVTYALGPKNVTAVMMPSQFSSEGSIKDSEKLAKNLGIKTKKIPIKDVYQSYEKIFKKGFPGKPFDVTEENIQARIRSNLLMAISNKTGALLVSTGNKSELGVGYCTLYGDMSGGLSVIADLSKTMVYEVSRTINRKKEIIPDEIIKKAPSAELRPRQKDQDTLPPYDVLDEILRLYVEEHRDYRQIVEQGYKPEIVKQVIGMVYRNEFKRRQASPTLRVSEKAFGIGRHFPIARKIFL